MNANGQMVESLVNSQIFRDYERSYAEATGLPLAFRPLETWQIPLHGKCNENPWCAMMAQKSRTCAACLQMQEKLAIAAVSQPCTMTCAYGLARRPCPSSLGLKPSAICKPDR